MRHAIYCRPLFCTPSLMSALLLLASASCVLAQEQKVRVRDFHDRIKIGDTVTQFLKPIQNVQVNPLAAGAIFNFETRDGANPTVRIGKAAPTQEPRGRTPQLQWGFKPEDEVPAYNAPRPRDANGTTTHRLRLQPVLAPNTTYYYIIEAIIGGQLVQETGSFTTIGRRVKVVFQKVHVLTGGDGTGTGDLMFQFFTNYDATTNRNFVWLGGRSTTLQIPDGGSVNVGKEFSLSNVDDLHLAVNGYDEDFLTVGAPPSSGSSNSVQVPYPLNGAGHNNAGAWNVAKADFDLASTPPTDKSLTVPFTLYSLPLPNNAGQDVAFEVSGYYTILPTISFSRGSISDNIRNYGKIFGTPKPMPPVSGEGQNVPAIRRRIKIQPQQ
ncbi:hypothetical protein IAD21_06363 [Abditibacteriota bacterium]|nr:hypothetical protein IAD21_06363 [Abditibacteriota bacterium]